MSYTDLAGLKRLEQSGSLADGMLPKASAIESAIRGGVRRVHVISYNARDSVLAEVFTNEGTGTMIVADVKALTPAEQHPERRQQAMNSKTMTIVAIVLIALGAFGLARGKFSYTEETHEAEIAGIELSVKDKETVAVPQWLSIGAIAARRAAAVVRPPEVLMLEMRANRAKSYP